MTKPAKAVNPNHIFVDTNVLIGGYSGDPRFQKDAACLHYLYSLNGKKLYISTLSVAQLISVYQKKKTNEEICRIVRELQHRFNVIDFTARVTNNYKDYRLLMWIEATSPEKVKIITK